MCKGVGGSEKPSTQSVIGTWRVMRKNVFPAVIGVHSSSPYRIPHRDKVISLSFKLADLIKHSSMRSGPKENVAVTDSCATWPNFLR